MIKYEFTSLQLSCIADGGMHSGVGAMLGRLFGNSVMFPKGRSLMAAFRLPSPQALQSISQRNGLQINGLQISSSPAGNWPAVLNFMAEPFGNVPSAGTTGIDLSIALYRAETFGLKALATALTHWIDSIQFLVGDRNRRRVWRSGQIRPLTLMLA